MSEARLPALCAQACLLRLLGQGFMSMSQQEPVAEVRFSCGRHYLSVCGFAVAMEGDRCREGKLPEDVMPPIPEEELAQATIGGKPASEMPTHLVRFFRGDNWTQAMLEYVAAQINRQSERR
jgi:hypothetical protein